VTVDYGKPFVDRLVAEDMVVRSDGTLVLTDAGHAAAERLFAARREGLRELLPIGRPRSTPSSASCSPSCPGRCSVPTPTATSSTLAAKEKQRGSSDDHRRAMP
jgi:hypothetical protein